jgi:hypothetical protein
MDGSKSGPRRAKMTHRNRKCGEILRLIFKMLNVLFSRAEAAYLVAWRSFMEACNLN